MGNYENCTNGREAVRVYLHVVETEREVGLRLDPNGDFDYFLDFIFPAKVALLFLESKSFTSEGEAIEAMKRLDDRGLEGIIEILESLDYSLFEF